MSRAGSQRVTCGLHLGTDGSWLATSGPVLQAYIFAKAVRQISLTFSGIYQSDFYRERRLWPRTMTVWRWGTDEEAGGSGDTGPSSRRPRHEQLRERSGRGLIATPSRIEVRRHPVPRRSTGRSVIGSTRCSWSMPVIS